jgi:hypothetical protein
MKIRRRCDGTMHATSTQLHQPSPAAQTFRRKLNTVWHERAMRVFMFIVLAHWAEHLLQAFQIYALGWPPPKARGLLGQFFPWLIRSESLHYGYAVVMLIGLWLLRDGFKRRKERAWWTAALVIQFWHHIEHLILLSQAVLGINYFGRPVPTSIIQLWIPRVELHLFYNAVVFVPMAIAVYHHMFPSAGEAASQECTCVVHRYAAAAVR